MEWKISIKASWHNAEKTIIRLDYISPWSWEEFVSTSKQAIEMAMTVSNSVGIISKPSVPSPRGNPLAYFAKSLKDLPDNVKIIAVVGSSHLANGLTKIALSAFPKYRERLFIAYSLAEAVIVKKLNQTQQAIKNHTSA